MTDAADPPAGLLTDRYELTMVEAALRSGVAHRPAVFEVSARRLPPGRRYGVVCGVGRLLDVLARFRFDEARLGWLRDTGVVGAATCDWLATWRFGGEIDAYAEGEVYVPGSPVLVVRADWASGALLETLVLSVLNHDSAVAAAASRMVVAAQGRPLIEMGSRRTHEEAAVAAARAAYVAGFEATSNLEAGRRYGIPTRGTAAHAFTLAHGGEVTEDEAELAAFRSQLAAQGTDTTLLVDTFDVGDGVRRAVRAAREAGASGPGAVRIDSGDLVAEAHRARTILDEAGAPATKVIATGDLDETLIAAVVASGAPVDAFGVGTSVVTGGGAPTAGFVYKLVEVGGRGVAKRSPGKAGRPGAAWAWRTPTAEVLTRSPDRPAGGRPLQHRVVAGGEPTPEARQVAHDLDAARVRHRHALADLGPGGLSLAPGRPALPLREEP